MGMNLGTHRPEFNVLFGKFVISAGRCLEDGQGSDQIRSVAQPCPTLCDPMNCSMPGLPVHHQLREFTKLISIESVMPSSHLILCHPLLLLPPIPPSIRVFSNESTLHMKWPKGSDTNLGRALFKRLLFFCVSLTSVYVC